MKNAFLSITISPKGAELTSIQDIQTGYEFLWQADPAIWGRHAPVLFPIVGKVLNNQLLINGTAYPMGQHGFVRDAQFTLIKQTDSEYLYELNSSPQTLAIFPYSFRLQLGYQLNDRSLICSYHIQNTGTDNLFFSIGAHPGFNLPTSALSDYQIHFDQPEAEERALLSGGLFNGTTKPVLTTPTIIQLSKELFDDDAIVFKNLNSSKLILQQLNGPFAIALDYSGFPHMGIWTQKGNESYICLEPWCGHADPTNGHADISEKQGIQKLAPSQSFERSYTLTFTPPDLNG